MSQVLNLLGATGKDLETLGVPPSEAEKLTRIKEGLTESIVS
jgi:hypothetical protein